MAAKKILVTYGSWMGSTAEVAERLGKVMRELGAQVDVIDGKQLKSAAGYDAVVIGTAVRAGMVPAATRKALRKAAHDASGKPTAGFVVCAAMTDPNNAKRESESAEYLTKVVAKFPAVQMLAVKPFAGAFLFENGRGLMAKMVEKMAARGKDFREWEAIEAWAREIYPRLAA